MDARDASQDLGHEEERMRSIVDHVLDGIITIDERATVRTFNPAAERIFGYRAEEVIGSNVKVLMPEPYHSEHDRYVSSYVGTGVPRIIGTGREVVGRRKDGSTFPMDLAVSEFTLAGSRYFTGIVRDISERRRLERELRERLDQLAEADRQKNEFLAMLGHELRNPLAPLRNALHLLHMDITDTPTVEAALGMMDRQLHQLVRLVDDLLDVSRIVRAEIDLRAEPIDVAVAVARGVETVQPVIEAHGHELIVEVPDEPMLVEGDLVRLAQVVANLLTNAAKYTDRAGRIRLSLTKEGGEAVLRVLDTGIGIPADLLPRIFDVFVQGGRALDRSQGGLGIGLTIVRRLVEMHGGVVTASSPGPGQGSEFVVRLPLLEQESVEAPLPRIEPSRRHQHGSQRRRVLVVDDNVDAAESIAMILRRAGNETRCVYDGLSVLRAAREFSPDAIVLDIGLPRMSGYEVAQQLRGLPEFARTLLIAVTGYGQDEDHARSRAAGFDHHLTKPVDVHALEALIGTIPAAAGATDAGHAGHGGHGGHTGRDGAAARDGGRSSAAG